MTRDFPAQETPAAVRRTRQLQRQSTVGCPALRHRPIWGFPSLKWMVYNGKSHEHGCFRGTPIFGNHMGWVKTSKPCSPFVHINIAGNWMFIPLKSEVKVERLDRNLSGGMDSLFFLRAHISTWRWFPLNIHWFHHLGNPHFSILGSKNSQTISSFFPHPVEYISYISWITTTWTRCYRKW